MRQRPKLFKASLMMTLAFTFPVISFAHHPNEGTETLSALLQEVNQKNFEIKEAQAQLESVTASKKKTISGFLPQISVDGGYQGIKLDSEKSNGPMVYGAASINLYNGGKDLALRESASQEESFQKIKLAKTKARIEREVSKIFYELLYFQEGLDLKEQALEVNKNQKVLAEKKKSAGFTSQADVLEFELREATLKSDINFLNRDETLKERELRRLIGRIDEQPIRVRGHLERANYSNSSQELLNLALKEREDLKEAEKNQTVSELSYKSLFGEYLPRVDVEGKYGKLGYEDRVYSQSTNYSIGLKISIPIFSGLETMYGREMKLKDISKNNLIASRLRQEIKVQIENSLSKLKSIGERLDIEEKNIELSKQYYEITVSEYKRGVKNSPDVAGAAERLFDSRFRNLGYRKEYLIAWVDVAEAVGVSSAELSK